MIAGEFIRFDGRIYICEKHPNAKIVIGIPVNIKYMYCTECIKDIYDNTEECPVCHVKRGFNHGTGDCGCQS